MKTAPGCFICAQNIVALPLHYLFLKNGFRITIIEHINLVQVVNPPNIAELESEVSQQESLREQRSSNEFLTWTVICVVIGVIALAVVAVLLLKLNKRRQFLS